MHHADFAQRKRTRGHDSVATSKRKRQKFCNISQDDVVQPSSCQVMFKGERGIVWSSSSRWGQISVRTCLRAAVAATLAALRSVRMGL
jgi:hypothetical protein